MNLIKILASFKSQITDDLNLEMRLNSLLADEFIAWYQYFVVAQLLEDKVKKLFLELATDELEDHANKLINRIHELGYKNFFASSLDWQSIAGCKYSTADLTEEEQITLNKNAEECAIKSYKDTIEYAQSLNDTETVKLLQDILKDEEEHLEKLNKI